MFKNSSPQLSGVIYVLISAFTFASLPIITKIAYQCGLNPENTTILRFFFAFVFMTAYIKIKKGEPVITCTPMVLSQGVVLTLTTMLFFYALQYMPAGLMTVIFFTHPILVAILAIFIFREKFSPQLFVGVILALIGVILTSHPDSFFSPDSYKGLILAVLASLIYAVYSLLGQKVVAHVNPLAITATQSLEIFLLVSIYYHNFAFLGQLNLAQLMITLFMAIFNTCIPFLFLLKGIEKIGAAQASLISTAEPPFAIIMAMFILHEEMNLTQIGGAILIFISVLLVVYPIPNIAKIFKKHSFHQV